MNLRDAKRLKPGAIVREAWGPEFRQGLVLSKEHVDEPHIAKSLSQHKEQRYDIVVHWLCRNPPRQYYNKDGGREPMNPQTRENWELMVVSHAS